jgi:putative salt-induced outer membrane protein YdiY
MKKSQLKTFILAALVAALPVSSPAAPLEGRLSLGYSDTTGNTEEEKINFDFNLKERRSDKFNLLYDGLFHYGKSAGDISADKKKLGVIGEFVKNPKNSIYVEAGGLKDRFAGYETRLNFGLGYYKTIIAEQNKNLKAQAGLEITKEDYTDSTSNTYRWLKLGLIGDKRVGENIKVLGSISLGTPRSDFEDRYEIDYSLGTLLP